MEQIFMTVEDAAQALSVPVRRVRELVRRREVASIRVGKRRLIASSSLERWAAEQLASAGFDVAGER